MRNGEPIGGASIGLDKPLVFTIVAVGVYLIFLYLLIFTALTLDGSCLYTFWLPNKWNFFTPYWMTVAVALVLMLWALLNLALCLREESRLWLHVAFYGVASVILAWWLYDLWGLWEAMAYERGEISGTDYFGRMLMRLVRNDPHECTSG